MTLRFVLIVAASGNEERRCETWVYKCGLDDF